MNSTICLICYDISSNKTRREIVKLLENYGKRIQESVFLCDLPDERAIRLDKELRAFYARKMKAIKKKKKPDENNTLDIFMIPMEPGIMDVSLVLGNEIDCGLSFKVI